MSLDIVNKQMTIENGDTFWINDPSILFSYDRALEFVPTSDMSTNEKLNSLTRFAIYLGVILLFISGKIRMLWISIVPMVIIYIIYINMTSINQNQKDKFESSVKEKFGISQNTPIKIDDKGDICQLPTPNNPFMNVLMTDYTANPNRPPACSHADNDVKELTNDHFDYNLYKDVSDVWEKRNSQREFVTMPSTTIPNDRDSFMKWCWKTTNVCRDGDMDYCLKYEDPRLPGN
jgi:hypothetical protein